MNRHQYCFDTLELKTNSIYKFVDQISNLKSTVLISGASGTGKEAICHLLHMKSRRAHNPMIPINCSAIPEELIEAELFGHEAGAFTGADVLRAGKLEQAAGGMIVLDEISEMNLKAQSKLLRVLESNEFYRLGGALPVKLNTRIVATTNRDLMACVRSGQFREDLFYRLDVMRVELPTLEERAKDIPLLADFFLNELIRENHRNIVLSPEVYHFLCQKKWEGNIRELKNFLTRLYFFSKSETITIHDLYNEISNYNPENTNFIVSASDLSLNEIEKKYILHTMILVNGNKSKAARTLKISLKTLRSKLKEYDYGGSEM
ncbi:MAG: sigma-54-dependent Fis family transcriptional regulator [Deltaproteobacteria bacterium]|nr:sigma-54-dependent Fis family transcriptional regulator [Deltaproteobacteria bacterium]